MDPDTVNNILTRVGADIEKHEMFQRGKPIVVAVSGGMDSVCLLDILYELAVPLGLELHVAHLDHQIRGKESREDAALVTSLAAGYDLPYHSDTADVKTYAMAESLSVEEAARALRRRFLEDVRNQVSGTRIATGHHTDDQAETVLLRLLRGSGTTGLAGMRPVAGAWVKPLLDVRRSEIQAYAEHRQLKWREDHTNTDCSIPRNQIRHALIPVLEKEYNAHTTEAIARAAAILGSDDELLDQMALEAAKTVVCVHSERKIGLDGLRFFGYHVAVQRRLIRHFLPLAGLDPRRVTFRLIDRILDTFHQGPQSLQVSDKLTACFTGRLILFGTSAPEFRETLSYPNESSHSGTLAFDTIGAELDIQEVPRQAFPSRFDQTTPYDMWFDRGALPANLALRSARPCDRIQPFGSSGSSKVSDILADNKIPRILRDEVPVLATPDEVLWVVGLRTSNKGKVQETSQEAVRFSFNGSWRHLYTAVQRFT